MQAFKAEHEKLVNDVIDTLLLSPAGKPKWLTTLNFPPLPPPLLCNSGEQPVRKVRLRWAQGPPLGWLQTRVSQALAAVPSWH